MGNGTMNWVFELSFVNCEHGSAKGPEASDSELCSWQSSKAVFQFTCFDHNQRGKLEQGPWQAKLASWKPRWFETVKDPFAVEGAMMLMVAVSYRSVEVACDAHVAVSYGFVEVR